MTSNEEAEKEGGEDVPWPEAHEPKIRPFLVSERRDARSETLLQRGFRVREKDKREIIAVI